MSAPPDVLDRNLEALLRRAYVPARPAPLFRARLAKEVRAACEQRARARSATRFPDSRAAAWVAVAAALLVSAFLWIRSSGDGTERTPQGLAAILGAGHVALRTEPEGVWRTLGASEESVPYETAYLELAAPDDGADVVVRTDEGRLDFLGGSLRLTRVRAEDERVDLAAGPAILVRLGGSRGAAALADAPHTALAAPARALLRRGELVDLDAPSPAETSATLDGARQPIRPATEPAPEPPEPPPLEPGIHGRVIVAETGLAATSFHVTMLRETNLPDVASPETRALESPEGRFHATTRRPGVYSVFVFADGYAVARETGVSLVDPEAVVELEFSLVRGGTIRGYVFDAETGAPVGGAHVFSEADFPSVVLPLFGSVEDTEHFLERRHGVASAPDGSFLLPNVSAGRQLLRANRPGHGPAWSAPLTLGPGQTVSDVVLELPPPSGVRGSVTLADGTPLEDAQIFASMIDYSGEKIGMTAGQARTDAEGQYEITGMGAGQITVVRVLDPELHAEVSTSHPRVKFATLAPGETEVVDFSEERESSRLVGRVRATGGEDVRGLGIMVTSASSYEAGRMEDWEASVLTEDGGYEFTALPPDDYYVFLSRGMNASMVYAGRVVVPTVPELRHDVDLPAGRVVGRVTDGQTGQPLDSAVIIVQSTGEGPSSVRFRGKGLTAEDGTYDLPFLESGTYEVTAYLTQGGYGHETVKPVRVESTAEPASVDLRLFPGGTLEVRVLDADGAPLSGASAVLFNEDGSAFDFAPMLTTDATGRVEIPGLRGGDWTLQASRDGYETATTLVRIVAGERNDVQLELRSETPGTEPR